MLMRNKCMILLVLLVIVVGRAASCKKEVSPAPLTPVRGTCA